MIPPRTRVVRQLTDDAQRYVRKANRISIRHTLRDVVAVIEFVSPGNKSSRPALQAFAEKGAALLRGGIHLLVIDLFPPSPRDPQGMPGAISEQFGDDPLELPPETRLTLAAYQSGGDVTAYIEWTAVGRTLPDMPLFLTSDAHVLAPLNATYEATWAACPEAVRELVG